MTERFGFCKTLRQVDHFWKVFSHDGEETFFENPSNNFGSNCIIISERKANTKINTKSNQKRRSFHVSKKRGFN